MIVRKVKKTNFTSIGNVLLQNKKLSFKARGLICLFLSLPDDWDFNKKGIEAFTTDGRESIESAIKELKKHKYLTIVKILPNKDNPKIDYLWTIYEEPYQDAGFQDTDYQDTGFQDTENQQLQNNNIQNNNNKIINNKLTNNKTINNNTDIYILTNSNNTSLVKPNEFINYFSKVCPSLPEIKVMSNNRKKAINTLIKKYGKDKFVEVLKKTESSDFLSGRSGNWGGCNIDWIIKPSNFIKILEGSYDNSRKKESEKERLNKKFKETYIQEHTPKSVVVKQSFDKLDEWIDRFDNKERVIDVNNKRKS